MVSLKHRLATAERVSTLQEVLSEMHDSKMEKPAVSFWRATDEGLSLAIVSCFSHEVVESDRFGSSSNFPTRLVCLARISPTSFQKFKNPPNYNVKGDTRRRAPFKNFVSTPFVVQLLRRSIEFEPLDHSWRKGNNINQKSKPSINKRYFETIEHRKELPQRNNTNTY